MVHGSAAASLTKPVIRSDISSYRVDRYERHRGSLCTGGAAASHVGTGGLASSVELALIIRSSRKQSTWASEWASLYVPIWSARCSASVAVRPVASKR